MSKLRKVDPIESYLVAIQGYVRDLPKESVDEIVDEIRTHLQSSIDALVELGWDPAVAPEEAIRRFGPAPRIGRQLIERYPYAWTWARDRHGLPTQPQLPRWIVSGAIVAVMVVGIRLHMATLSLLIGALFGVFSEILSIMQKAFEAGQGRWVAKSISVGRSLPPIWTRPLLSRMGMASFVVNLRLSAEQPISAWRFGSVMTLAIASITMLVVHIPRHNHSFQLDAPMFAAMAIGSIVSRATMAVFAKRVAVKRS